MNATCWIQWKKSSKRVTKYYVQINNDGETLRDFTLDKYRQLCVEIQSAGYRSITIEQYAVGMPHRKAVMLRHDVDSWPRNALDMAYLEHSLGIISTYYFRRSPLSENREVINDISSLGHEIGYHYEDLATHRGNFRRALQSFKDNLEHFRSFYPVRTAVMHGRPLSKWDSKDLWKQNSYKELGIVCEPYLDIDFQRIAYLTDTGNCWNGEKYSVRDHVTSKYSYNIHTTDELIEQIRKNSFPDFFMLNIHPARWNNNLAKWIIRDYILSKPKYFVKKWLKKRRTK